MQSKARHASKGKAKQARRGCKEPEGLARLKRAVIGSHTKWFEILKKVEHRVLLRTVRPCFAACSRRKPEFTALSRLIVQIRGARQGVDKTLPTYKWHPGFQMPSQLVSLVCTGAWCPTKARVSRLARGIVLEAECSSLSFTGE